MGGISPDDNARGFTGERQIGPDESAEPIAKRNGGDVTHQVTSKAEVIDPRSLEGKPVPEREWIVPGWIARRGVTMVSGDGGTGKTLLMMQLATACGLDRADWLGRPVRRCRSVLMLCEDDRDELHRRQADINEHFAATFSELGAMRWMPREGCDNALVTLERDRETFEHRLAPTGLYQQLSNVTQDHGADLLIIDSLHDVFGGNENDRYQARRFIHMLADLARDMDGAVIITAHPSRAGLADRTGASGSTAWNNSVRQRLYLTRPVTEDGDEQIDDRVLTDQKANYDRKGKLIRMHWRAGVFVSDDPPTGILRVIEEGAAEDAFMDGLQILIERGVNASPSPNATNYAPKIVLTTPPCRGLTRPQLAKAMNDLFGMNRITTERYGRAGDTRTRIVIAETEEQHGAGGG